MHTLCVRGLRAPGFLLGLFAGILLLAGCAASRQHSQTLPAADSLPPQAVLPDPLVMLDGRRVTTREQWYEARRPELKRLFEHYEYGSIPPRPARVEPQLEGEYRDFLGGSATLKLVTLRTGEGSAPKIRLMLILPNQRRGPAPVFLVMNFCGNQALTEDPRVPLAEGWLYDNCKGCSDHFATEASRGTQATNFPLAEIVRRGYALASFNSADIDSDRPDVSSGIYAWLAGGDPARNNPASRGTIAAWAWGYMRCVDYLVTDPALDKSRIAAMGHSRNGKTTFLAAAFDERIAIAFPHQAGTGGSAPSRSQLGESVKAINDHFPHWFNAEFKKFNNDPQRLPVDQNCLLALCAPRPVMFSAADGDQWANPAGQFAVLKATDPVYRFLGAEGISAGEMPPLSQTAGDRLGFFQRAGKHSLTAQDWDAFLNFADAHFRTGKGI